VGRIVLTALLSPVFCWVGLVGPVWAVVCLTVPLGVELIASVALASPFIRALEAESGPVASRGEVLRFALTLSVGYVFLSLSAYIVGSFAARASEPERMLPAYYLALGLTSPVAYGASRLQALVLSYSGSRAANSRLIGFSLCAGAVLGMLPLLFILPGVCRVYYVVLQKLPAADLALARIAAAGLAIVPLSAALRAYGEGRAAYLKRPEVILTGQAVYLGMVSATAFFSLALGVPGNLIGAVAVTVGNLCASGTVILALGGLWRSAPPTAAAVIQTVPRQYV
jgi:hypothetical protein